MLENLANNLVWIDTLGPVAVKSVVSGPGAASGNLLEMHSFSSHPILNELKSLGVGPSMLCVVVYDPAQELQFENCRFSLTITLLQEIKFMLWYFLLLCDWCQLIELLNYNW